MAEPGTILVASRAPERADVRKQRLEDAGYRVVSALNIQEVPKACEKQLIRLTVIGHSLPPVEKRRVWLEIRERCGNHVPVLELRNNESVTVADSTVSHFPEKRNELAERARRILEN